MLLDVAVDGKVRFVATDGHRLGYAEVAVLDGTPPPKDITLPGSVVCMLIDRLPEQTEEFVTVSVEAGSFGVECGRFFVGDDLVGSRSPSIAITCSRRWKAKDSRT